eukprot:Nk52_evm4s358 gene=Nk52_evmTU4s358
MVEVEGEGGVKGARSEGRCHAGKRRGKGSGRGKLNELKEPKRGTELGNCESNKMLIKKISFEISQIALWVQKLFFLNKAKARVGNDAFNQNGKFDQRRRLDQFEAFFPEDVIDIIAQVGIHHVLRAIMSFGNDQDRQRPTRDEKRNGVRKRNKQYQQKRGISRVKSGLKESREEERGEERLNHCLSMIQFFLVHPLNEYLGHLVEGKEQQREEEDLEKEDYSEEEYEEEEEEGGKMDEEFLGVQYNREKCKYNNKSFSLQSKGRFESFLLGVELLTPSPSSSQGSHEEEEDEEEGEEENSREGWGCVMEDRDIDLLSKLEVMFDMMLKLHCLQCGLPSDTETVRDFSRALNAFISVEFGSVWNDECNQMCLRFREENAVRVFEKFVGFAKGLLFPAVHIVMKIPSQMNIPKFARGFLHGINEQVVIYRRFLEQLYEMMEEFDRLDDARRDFYSCGMKKCGNKTTCDEIECCRGTARPLGKNEERAPIGSEDEHSFIVDDRFEFFLTFENNIERQRNRTNHHHDQYHHSPGTRITSDPCRGNGKHTMASGERSHQYSNSFFSSTNTYSSTCPSWMDFASLPPKDRQRECELYLLGILQRSHGIHAGISLTGSGPEIRQERDYFSGLLRKLLRSFFPNGSLMTCFHLLFNGEPVTSLGTASGGNNESLEVILGRFLEGMEPFVDSVMLDCMGKVLQENVDEITNSRFINAKIISFVLKNYKHVYDDVVTSCKEARALIDVLRRKQTEHALGSEPSSDILFGGITTPEGEFIPFNDRNSQRFFAMCLVGALVRDFLSSSAAASSSSSSGSWTTNAFLRLYEGLLKAPCCWLFDYENLVVDCVMQLFDLLQNQIFVKNFIFFFAEYVVDEIQATCNSTTIFNYNANNRNRSPEKKEHNNAKQSEMDEFQSGKASRQENETQSSREGSYFASVFEELRGDFVTELAKNLVSMLTLSQRLGKTREVGPFEQQNVNDESEHVQQSPTSTFPSIVPPAKGGSLSSRNYISAHCSTLVLEMTSRVQGVRDVVGEIIVYYVEAIFAKYKSFDSIHDLMCHLVSCATDDFQREIALIEVIDNIFSRQVDPAEILDFDTLRRGSELWGHKAVHCSLSMELILEHIFTLGPMEGLETIIESLIDFNDKVALGNLVAAALFGSDKESSAMTTATGEGEEIFCNANYDSSANVAALWECIRKRLSQTVLRRIKSVDIHDYSEPRVPRSTQNEHAKVREVLFGDIIQRAVSK